MRIFKSSAATILLFIMIGGVSFGMPTAQYTHFTWGVVPGADGYVVYSKINGQAYDNAQSYIVDASITIVSVRDVAGTVLDGRYCFVVTAYKNGIDKDGNPRVYESVYSDEDCDFFFDLPAPENAGLVTQIN